ncbi:MAG: CopG family transcriptional regulator [bacterium]
MKIKSKTVRAKNATNAGNLEARFDAGENVLDYFDVKNAKVVRPSIRRVNVDFPMTVLHRLDVEASRVGVTRQSLIKMWLFEKLESRRSKPKRYKRRALYS